MTVEEAQPGPLDGLLVLDMTQALAGPYLGMLLGDLGANVIKIERPGSGDQARGWGPPFAGAGADGPGESSYFMSINRNKRSLTCNLKSANGREVLRRLLLQADVLITNERRQATRQAMGFDYASAKELNPRIVYCSITGFGMTGPYAEKAGYDIIAQAMAGLMPLTGAEDSPPMRYPASIADMATTLYGLGSVLAALYARDTRPERRGQFIDLSLVESQAWWSVIHAAAYFMSGEAPPKLGNDHPSIVPYGAFRAQDGYLIIGGGSEPLWRSLCAVLGMEDVRDDPHYAINRERVIRRDEVRLLIENRLANAPVAEWVERLEAVGVPAGPIYSVPEMLADEHMHARGFVVEQAHPVAGTLRTLRSPLRLSETSPNLRLPPPLLGQHTDEILAELGYSQMEIEALRRDGAV
ncbi:MAG: CoA transferase [Anaerolineae bacterium]|nr:CoA transferase [Anaerolineae bacterium]